MMSATEALLWILGYGITAGVLAVVLAFFERRRRTGEASPGAAGVVGGVSVAFTPVHGKFKTDEGEELDVIVPALKR